MKSIKALVLFVAWAALATPLAGVETSFWQIGTFDEFLQGTLQNVSLSKEGELKLAPEAQTVFNPEEALALSMAADRQGNLYIGTGHLGRVFRVDSKQKGSLFFTAEESDIFALACGPDGALYVGSSPEGKIYRVTPDGKSTVFYDPEAKYIWALAFDSKGNLYVGTGDQGRILKIDPAGKSEVFFDSKQTHIMCLTFDSKGNLLAGSVPNGLVYRIDPTGKAFVLYQDTLPEIHELAVDSKGRIYAAALGGAGGKGSQHLFAPQPGIQQTAPVTTVTVTAGAGEVPGASEAQQQPPRLAAATTPSLTRSAPQASGLAVPQIPQGRGSLIQILPDYSAETLWSSNKESIFGLAVRDNQVLFSTDANGRIFDLTPSPDGQKLTLLTATQESLATRLMLRGPDLYIATSNIGKLFRVGSAVGHEGSFESPVKDMKMVSRWGTLTWRGEAPEGAAVEFYTRSGNSDRPDRTWSDWAGPYANPGGSAITSPPARYLQWKGILRSSSGGSPMINEVTISYVNQNLPPQIRSLDVSTSSERTGPTGTSSTSGSGATTTVTVTSIPTVSYPGPSSSSANANPKPTTLSWKADDPNGDTLVFSLQVRAADEEAWHLVKDKLQQTSYTLDPNSLADGKYVARLIASDEPSNPQATARSTELVSAPFWVDSTPPQVRALSQKVTAAGVEVAFQAEDATSPLSQAETSLDGEDWQDVDSDDGIVDTQSETFTVRTPKLDPGEHVLTLRATDTAGNVGVGKAVLRIPAASGHGR
jgi:sugar lactone lactonase YvrE